MSEPVLRLDRLASEPADRPRLIFGFRPSTGSVDRVVGNILSRPRTAAEGVGLIVTPNIDHIAQLQRNIAFHQAYANAAMILCDGFPVHYYALATGHAVDRVTGCELLARLLEKLEFGSAQRLFFVVDSERTARAVQEWADRVALRDRVMTHVPPFGFEADPTLSASLADEIRAHSTTLLVMAVGAPRSEIFVDQHRNAFPPCWAICIGQGVKVAVGVVRRAPRLFRFLNAEWLWRLVQEPRRLGPRYMAASTRFVLCVFQDVWEHRSG